MLEVRKARADEIDAVLDFYAKMIAGMQGTDFDVQWRHDGHPSKDFLREAVADGQMIVGVLEGEGIASAMVVNHEGEPGYEAVPWSVDAPPENVGVLHVVATLPAYHGRGFARQLLQGGMEHRPRRRPFGPAPGYVPLQRARPRPLRVLRVCGQGRVNRVLSRPRRHPSDHVRAAAVASSDSCPGASKVGIVREIGV